MTDRELLELSAKAAGIEIEYWLNDNPRVVEMFRGHLPNHEVWNPLTNDGDALRLAVKLRLQITITEGVPEDASSGDAVEYAATRRAIVQAAAEIGRVTL